MLWIQKWPCIFFHKERVHPSVPQNQKSNLPLWGGTQVEGAAWDEEFIGSVKVHKEITIQFSWANKFHNLKPESTKVPIIWSAFTLQEEERVVGGRAACLLARQGTWSGWIWSGWRWGGGEGVGGEREGRGEWWGREGGAFLSTLGQDGYVEHDQREEERRRGVVQGPNSGLPSGSQRGWKYHGEKQSRAICYIYLGQAVSTQVQFSFPQVRQRGGERPRVAVDVLDLGCLGG